jgi:hypothetical protein
LVKTPVRALGSLITTSAICGGYRQVIGSTPQ